MRKSLIERKTLETEISVAINLDGNGKSEIHTGVGFFDHMLEQIAKHGKFDLKIQAKGDTHIDDHHSVEDVGIAMGQAFAKAIGDKKGIYRYGECFLPMDETLSRVVLDISGRPFLVWNVKFTAEKIGTFDVELVREWFQAFAMHSGITLHVETLYGCNSHHIAESCFKGLAKALRKAVAIDIEQKDVVPSTKGVLEG